MENIFVTVYDLFFFFFEKPVKDFIQITAKLLSINTKESTSLGMSSNQTWGTTRYLANLANLLATTLPFPRIWENKGRILKLS